METEEMKQVNEEILNKWRKLGLLQGLKEGSINEWRCAKSFENAANCILNNEYESYSLTVFAFPFIRRVICTGKKRLHRILIGEEVCDFLTTITVGECLTEMKSKVRTPVGKALLGVFENYVDYADITMHASESSLTDFMDGIRDGSTHTEEMLKALMKGVFDSEAELLSAATDIFVERNIKKEKEG
jgi:hypothetical protein